MSRPRKMYKYGLFTALAVAVVLGAVACSVDSPTAPDQVAADPPTVGADSWKITVNVNPEQIQAGADVPSTVKVKVESKADGSKPANGTTMTISTTLGDFNAKDSGIKSVGVPIQGGQASALLFGGDVVATGTVVARLAGSEKRDTFQVIGAQEAFITSVEPNSGPQSGGTHIRINGIGFVEPLRVEIGDVYGTVVSVTPEQIRAVTPGLVFDFDWDTISCGVNGLQNVPTPVNVTVEFAGDASDAVLDNGFIYEPDDESCVEQPTDPDS